MTPETENIGAFAVTTGSASVGRSQRLAAGIWSQFKAEELRYVDMLELVAVLLVNVADKSESTDHEIAHLTRKLVADMRHQSRLQNTEASNARERNQN